MADFSTIFQLLTLSIFCVIKLITSFKRKKEEFAAEPAPVEPSAEEKLLTEIRDLLAILTRDGGCCIGYSTET